MNTLKTISINDEIVEKINLAIGAALMYEEVTGGKRKLGVTGEVGEIMVCEQLGLKLVSDPRSTGFDAIDRNGKHVQIKTRRSESEGLPRPIGRVSRFSNHKFDYALLALMDRKYNVCQIWRAPYSKIKSLTEKEQTDRSGPRLASFMKIGEIIFDKKCEK